MQTTCNLLQNHRPLSSLRRLKGTKWKLCKPLKNLTVSNLKKTITKQYLYTVISTLKCISYFFITICIIYSFSFIVIQCYFTSLKTYYSKLFEINIIKQLTTVLEVLAIDETFVRKKYLLQTSN